IPVVQRAGDLTAVHDALAERPTLVRAAVAQRENLPVPRTKHGDVADRTWQSTRSPAGDFGHRADINPGLRLGLHVHVHAGANSSRRLMGLNCSWWRPATRSAQGSTRWKRCEKAKRS